MAHEEELFAGNILESLEAGTEYVIGNISDLGTAVNTSRSPNFVKMRHWQTSRGHWPIAWCEYEIIEIAFPVALSLKSSPVSEGYVSLTALPTLVSLVCNS